MSDERLDIVTELPRCELIDGHFIVHEMTASHYPFTGVLLDEVAGA